MQSNSDALCVMTSENELGDNLIANVKSDVRCADSIATAAAAAAAIAQLQLHKLLFQCSMVS